jgi:hypothetical protein
MYTRKLDLITLRPFEVCAHSNKTNNPLFKTQCTIINTWVTSGLYLLFLA